MGRVEKTERPTIVNLGELLGGRDDRVVRAVGLFEHRLLCGGGMRTYVRHLETASVLEFLQSTRQLSVAPLA